MLTIDFDFRDQLLHANSSLSLCYQCGTCSGSCPIALITNGDFNPRKIIEASILGLKHQLLDLMTPNAWYCATCMRCVELCPQGVELFDIFETITNILIQEGKVPDAFVSQATEIYETGLAVPYGSAILKRREKLNLPTIKTANIAEIQQLCDGTGLSAIIEHVKKQKEENQGDSN